MKLIKYCKFVTDNLQAGKGFTLAGGFCVARSEAELRQCERTAEQKNFLLKILKRSSSKRTASKIQERAFTLAEVLITLAIIGVVAAITIPSVIVNTNQMEFKTGLRKAVSVLNQAITLNKALTGESPYDNSDLYNYLQQYMSVMYTKVIATDSGNRNLAFYTTDGMRFEVYDPYNGSDNLNLYDYPLYENPDIYARFVGGSRVNAAYIGNCGSMGLANNPDSTTNSPCIMVVDVNGDRKPTPKTIKKGTDSYGSTGNADKYYYTVDKYKSPTSILLPDLFAIMITDQGAIPYGTLAQKAMYQAQK